MIYFAVNKTERDKSGPLDIAETDFPVAPYVYENDPVIVRSSFLASSIEISWFAVALPDLFEYSLLLFILQTPKEEKSPSTQKDWATTVPPLSRS